MKKNLFLRLCLTMGLLSLNACRQDIPEQETYNNSGAFQLTSKRISLNEAKHKANLVSKIKQVETNLYNDSKNNLQGKTVNFGNGISIDTDDVIYLEKGPDFHSYTFRIDHENAPANAPIENLVISSRPDGTWKEVLVTYYLTPLERQNLLSGGTVDFTGKVTHEILQNGTYSSAIMQQDVMNCHMEISTYYTRCGDTDDHHHGELTGTAGPCRSETPSVLVVSLVKKCTVALPADTGLGENGEGGGSGPGGLGSNPPDETTTAPNLPPKGSPCQKAINNNVHSKELLADVKIAAAQTQLTSSLATDTNEKSFSFGKDAIGDYDTTPINTSTAGNQVGVQANNPNLAIEGGGHTHTIDLYNCFSSGDIYSLQGANAINSNFKTFFVFANGGVVYALTITDPVKYANFVANNPAGTHLDITTSYWKPTSPIYAESENIKDIFAKQGLSDDDAYANAVAFVLNKYDMGATVSQKDAAGNFNSIFIKENIINVNIGGVNVPITTYTQTTTCNLK
ncbi:hypothetical protein PGH12_09175 [Chryseobacterium wangxinyae]|uniref:hypothetical protein n=1 Tax=Chryseobacterium sp. CY350 TaxID=2997336 RepID=UPI0022708CB3|nr:hypothetical protein [Chryseobacterium sp. CY350]MCY0978966.1 hypothetical protein [Chryseobacterium sp. CY350]WBZ97305.1 hypothetical protein PGH12_09175 [Chryseobacterium sp. CY350]